MHPNVLVSVCKFRFYFVYFEKVKGWRDKILSICNKYYIVTVVLERCGCQNQESESSSPPGIIYLLPADYNLQKLIIWESGKTLIYRTICREILYYGTREYSTHFDQPVIHLLFIFPDLLYCIWMYSLFKI